MTRRRVLVLQGYRPQFAKPFANCARAFADVVELREVDRLSEWSERLLPFLGRTSATEYEILAPKHQPELLWRSITARRNQHRYREALDLIENHHGAVDVIHGHFYSSALHLARCERPLVITEHSNAFARSIAGEAAAARGVKLARTVYEHADMALPVSAHLAEIMREAHIRIPMRVLYNPIDPAVFEFAPRRALAPGAPIRLVTACRLEPTKNLDQALMAISLLARRGLEVEWKVLGEGKERRALEELATSQGLSDSVEMMGHQTQQQVVGAMRRAHAYLMASKVESFGLPVVEAMLSGLPVVATPVGIARELTAKRQIEVASGFDTTSIADAISALLDRYPEASSGGEVESVRVRFSPDTIAEQLESVYERVIA